MSSTFMLLSLNHCELHELHDELRNELHELHDELQELRDQSYELNDELHESQKLHDDLHDLHDELQKTNMMSCMHFASLSYQWLLLALNKFQIQNFQ